VCLLGKSRHWPPEKDLTFFQRNTYLCKYVLGYFCNVKKLPKDNYYPKDENWANLVSLLDPFSLVWPFLLPPNFKFSLPSDRFDLTSTA
jgi:hypothetical protein